MSEESLWDVAPQRAVAGPARALGADIASGLAVELELREPAPSA